MDLNFSYNWNQKLDNKAFTTIRRTEYPKGQSIKIYLNKVYLKSALIVAVKPFKLHQLNEFMSYLDTGYSVDECKEIIRKMYQLRYPDWQDQTYYFHLLLSNPAAANV